MYRYLRAIGLGKYNTQKEDPRADGLCEGQNAHQAGLLSSSTMEEELIIYEKDFGEGCRRGSGRESQVRTIQKRSSFFPYVRGLKLPLFHDRSGV